MSLLQSTLQVAFEGGESNAFGDITDNKLFKTVLSLNAINDGTASGQGKHAMRVTGTASTGGVSVDLTAMTGGLNGATIDYSANGAHLCAFIYQNLDDTHTITLSQPVSNGWTGLTGAATGLSLPLGPNDAIVFWLPSARMAVGASNKLLTLTSDAGTPKYRITLVG